MPIEKILIIDPDSSVRNFLSTVLKNTSSKFDIVLAESGNKALKLLADSSFDLVFTEMDMPKLSGLDILRKASEFHSNMIVVIATGHGSIENSVEAMRLGAFDYIQKPFSSDTVEAILEKAEAYSQLKIKSQHTCEACSTNRKIIAESPAMKSVLKDLERIANSNANIFITGESGTGKEVIAQRIHYTSPRTKRPFIKVNCAAIAQTLMESEFFGHEKGAFTGANLRHLGRFELASGGTLLLDEVTEISVGLQAKLLRVIQEQEFERVGGTKSVNIDVRVISTTNRDLQDALALQILRKDLYYRLNVVSIHLPPLRNRREDIIPLAEYFVERMCLQNNKPCRSLSSKAKVALLAYSWPGNIRELANIIERTIVLDNQHEITPAQLRF